MNMKKIMEYQEIDRELRKHEIEIEKNEDIKSANAAKMAFSSARNSAQQCALEATKIISRFEKIQKAFDVYSTKIDSLEKGIEKGDIELEQIYALVEQLGKMKDDLAKGDRELAELGKKIDEVQAKFNESLTLARRNKKLYSDKIESYNAFVEGKEAVMKVLKERLDKMSGTIDPVIMKKYQHLRKDKLVPVFTPLIDGTRCGYCRIEQSKGRLAQLTSENQIECESCRRYIFLDK